jgi:aspartate/methionine/tyrosine aminotransferase
LNLPEFALEVYFSQWEFAATHHLCASDSESMSVGDLLAFDDGSSIDDLLSLPLQYIPPRGTDELRSAVARTYDRVTADQVMTFAGGGEALFWALQVLAEPGDHVIVTLPNYQCIESVPQAAGFAVEGLPLWSGSGGSLTWELDLERFESMVRPDTRIVAVNFPNNPSGFVPDHDTWARFIRLCDERSIRVISDEVYRGVELDASRTLTQAADLSETALSINVMSKAYGLPGLRVGWVATRDERASHALERAKHYTSICNAAPSEMLATAALRQSERLLQRTRGIISANAETTTAFMSRRPELFEYSVPDGGCVSFPRYLGAEGVDEFCRRAVEDHGVLMLPGSVYRSPLGDVPRDRFRLGIGRADLPKSLDRLDEHLASRT